VYIVGDYKSGSWKTGSFRRRLTIDRMTFLYG